MPMELPTDREYNEVEKQWLRDRDRHQEIADNAVEFGGVSEKDVELPPTDPSQSPQVKSALDPEASTRVVTEVLPQGTVQVEDDYESWKVGELKNEADNRDPKVEYESTKKPDLIAALRAWDSEHPEAVTPEE